jgi:ABC-type uncharacterized transport system permease subunit
MVEVELTWSRILRIWWGLLWRYLLYALLLGLVIGFIVAIVVRVARFDMAINSPLNLIMVTLTALTASLWASKKVFQKKRFGDFRIALLTDIEGGHAVEDTQTNQQFDIR